MVEKVYYKTMNSLGPYEKKPHLAVAVSGGCDSLCLSFLAKKWVNSVDGRITALLVNHGLRKESDKECIEVKKILKKMNIRCLSFKWKLKKKLKNRVQEEARKFRYNIIQDWCFKNNVKHLLVAHHFEDQKETFLMRLNSNSNIYGLACMPKVLVKKEIRILRPFLDIKKEEIIKFLKEKEIKWIEDPSNASTKYFRNKIRKILPELEKKGLTDIKLRKLIKKAQEERQKIEVKFNYWFKKNVKIYNLGYASLNIKSLKLLAKDEFIFNFCKILTIISGSTYAPKSRYVYNFYKKIKSNKILPHVNLGGCHIFIYKEKLYVSREIFKRSRKQEIDFQFNKIIWDNRFEIKYEKNNLFLKKGLGKLFFIKQLQLNGWNTILSNNANLKQSLNLPNKVILTLPAIKNKKNDVLYVPHLKYYSNINSKKEFSNINFFFKPRMTTSNIY